ncbi:uridine kinase [Cellulomonas shaoxiangyii]|uniref:Uridine kinase n=1 Tax=Cellulomonas shaoxiangyii TaxID=2566013 RepID=A0A4P7SH49_9CELL|nr:uridine kinase [Cellulomonas shaoxiangyii]QCB92988.1 uridine kinase [Cellulomonas shaoxiangyii]TGY78783.1 uridine kinase [Cellulomonas shaoxiangyii]
MTTARADVVGRVAALVPDPVAAGAPVRVAVDGTDGAGKTWFADELADALRAAGRPVVRASVDGFHHPAAARYRRGRASPEGFFLDSYDLDAFRRVLLDAFAPGGSRRYRTAVHDVVTDRPVDAPWRTAPAEAVLVVDGVFLQRDELADAWDLRIWLDAPVTETYARMAVRDGCPADPGDPANARYLGGQRLYLAACDPVGRADVVVDNADVARPVLRAVRAS